MKKKENEKRNTVIHGIGFILAIIVLKKVNLISMPNSNDMIEFQFDLITVSTVFAGFSFTVLGMLMGMFSEPLMKKLEDTTIVTEKSKKLMKSIFFFCISGIVSLLFIVGIDRYILNVFAKAQGFIEYFFVSCIFFLVIGIVYFLKSTVGVFKIISKMYGVNSKRIEKQKKIYEEAKKNQKKIYMKNE